ncbi:protease [Paenibacillus sp. S-12]|uniref:protease n=1 Tax=Paenibacillus sp. S-12 TaxID=3031371 RepID=UPI0025A0DA3A|nr:protease [Paenibacillus sp. S-12]
MQTLYWGLLIFGVLYAIVSLLIGEVLSHVFDGLVGDSHLTVLQPTILVSGLSTLGAIGILLGRYTAWQPTTILLTALAGAIVVSISVYFLYVRPMENSENSIGFSIAELAGKIGEVNVAIPAAGYGEVIVRIGAGVTNQIAASFDKEAIPSGTTIVVVEVKEDTLYVSPLTEEMLRPEH